MNAIDGLMPVAVPIADYLLDSLVLGTALTGLVTLLLRLWRGLNPSTRYVVWLGALLAVVALPMLASPNLSPWNDALPFLSSAETASTSSPSTSSPPPPSGPETATPSDDDGASASAVPSEPKTEAGDDRPSGASSPAPTRSAASAAEASPSPDAWQLPATAALGLLGLWALAALVALARRASAYAHLARRRRASEPIEPDLQRRWLDLAQREGVNRAFDLRRCDEIASPMIAGCGRPAVLLPPRLLERISAEDLDRLVLHELAHLARWDDVLKWAQELIQALLVLHPAVGWIGRNLDVEREMACDDWAVTRHAQSRDRYAASLEQLVRWAVQDRAQPPKGRDSALTARTDLERRMRRMLRSTRTASARLMRMKLAGAIGLLLVGAGGLALTMPTLGVGSAGALGPLAASQPQACDVTLSPDQSIQSAIADADSGATICLESGEWEESVAISKPLTLRGLGDERVTIRGTEESTPDGFTSVVLIRGENVDITLQNLELLSAQPGNLNGVQVAGSTLTQSASLSVQDTRIAKTEVGMRVNGPNVTATVRNAVIEDNEGFGIVADRAESLTVIDSMIRENVGIGIDLKRGVQATVRGSTIRGTKPLTGGGTMLTAKTSIGINVGTDSQLRLVDSVVANNGASEVSGQFPVMASFANTGVNVGQFASGPTSQASAQAEIVSSQIQANRVGLVLGETSDLHMEGTTVNDSLSWGVAGAAAPCLLTDRAASIVPSRISGNVTFAGDNVVRNNNTSGTLDGKGNPGNHPFTDLPDGQVCLPMGEPSESEENEDSAQAVPAECTVALAPEESIQAAIDEASSGDTICLKSGEYRGVALRKSITLRGLGDERVTIQGRATQGESGDEGFSVAVLMQQAELDVELRNLELVQADFGIFMANNDSLSLTVDNVRVAQTNVVGITVDGQNVTAQIRNSIIEANGGGLNGVGIQARGDLNLTVTDTRIVNNEAPVGFSVERGATAVVRDTTIRGNAFSGTGVGINIGEGHLRLINSVVRNNGGMSEGRGDLVRNAGLNIGVIGRRVLNLAPSPASAEIRGSEIAGNRRGIMLGPTAEASLQGNRVRQNVGWGLATLASPCVEQPPGDFTTFNGDMEFAGGNTIEGNNTSGALDGKGNPGEHPFTDLPDGQVCLPQD